MVCKTPPLFGASWGLNNTIVFANLSGGLWRVSTDGGVPTELTTLDPKRGEDSHRLPQMLPDGTAVIFTIEKEARRWDDAQVAVRSLVTGEQKVLLDGAADARYVPTGHLVYARMGTLMAVPFDLNRLEVTSGPRGVLEDVVQAVNASNSLNDTGAAQFSVSESGSLIYVSGGMFPDRKDLLMWHDRSGSTVPLPETRLRGSAPRISPDGKQFMFHSQDRILWTFDIARGTESRFTTERVNASRWPIWTPDGKRVTYQSTTGGPSNLSWTLADGGAAERLTTSEHTHIPTSWSPDGKTLAFLQLRAQERLSNSWDIWTLSLDDDGAKTQPFLETPFNEMYAEFSPDGRWLAYSSNETGRDEIYVRAYPETDSEGTRSQRKEGRHRPGRGTGASCSIWFPAPIRGSR